MHALVEEPGLSDCTCHLDVTVSRTATNRQRCNIIRYAYDMSPFLGRKNEPASGGSPGTPAGCVASAPGFSGQGCKEPLGSLLLIPLFPFFLFIFFPHPMYLPLSFFPLFLSSRNSDSGPHSRLSPTSSPLRFVLCIFLVTRRLEPFLALVDSRLIFQWWPPRTNAQPSLLVSTLGYSKATRIVASSL